MFGCKFTHWLELDDDQTVVTPKSFQIEFWDGEQWQRIAGQDRKPVRPTGLRPNTVSFASLEVTRLRVVLEHAENGRSGLTEIEAWGPGEHPYIAPRPPLAKWQRFRTESMFQHADYTRSGLTEIEVWKNECKRSRVGQTCCSFLGGQTQFLAAIVRSIQTKWCGTWPKNASDPAS